MPSLLRGQGPNKRRNPKWHRPSNQCIPRPESQRQNTARTSQRSPKPRMVNGGVLTKTRARHAHRTRAERHSASPAETWALVAAAQAGDRAAFAELYTSHVDLVLTYVVRRTRNQAMAEDITSEAFTRAFARLDTLRHQNSTFRSWVITIARNLMTDEYVSARNRLVGPMPVDFDLAANTADPHTATFTRLLRQDLCEAFTHLTDDQRTCIIHRFFEGLSVDETAQHMGRSRQCIRSLQFRAMRTLAKIVPRELATA